MIKGFLTVGGWTLLSRVLGFVRDILIARFLGTGAAAEAFFVAFSLPNMFRRFFAEGAFNMAFVPLYAKKLEADPEEADAFARDALAMMVLVLTLFSVIGILAMPALVLAMASGFAGDERFDLAVAYGRIAFPYILLISLGALVSGVLNSNRRFLAAAAAPALLNVVFIAAMTLAWIAPEAVQTWLAVPSLPRAVGWLLIAAVPFGGLAQLGLVAWAARRAGHRLWPRRRPRLTPDLKRLLIIAAPALLANGVLQVNLLVGRQVASLGEQGAIAWLSYADRLYQLPLGVVGIAIGIVLLPELSRRIRAEDAPGQKAAYSRAAEFSLLLTIPAMVAFLVVPIPLVSVLFERGEFAADDTAATALALMIYAIGLPAFVLQKVLQPLFYAREDTRSPLRFALFGLVANAAIAIGLFPFIGWPAAAFGTTVASWAMLLLLWRGVRRMGDVGRIDARARGRVWRILVASALMGVVLWASQFVLGPTLIGPLRAVVLAAMVVVGMGSYALFALLTGAATRDDLRMMIRRQR
ncbi:murein biosynthesis integral membrane protein MurJ [Jannaschia aquimarina]|uniref:Probable lipid II flippase MurJ n=1 Tax=Jannaschia aquimarina TaxID=935700 RepID=A0A0D1D214_9RHOB|nr:murein biosynthesis integral membrane protein MurJ [Jannaschia aquimarina]KIT14183.1 putative peptidoglycan biosynthesis protein MurJ [Jannaschia aquimarina]SNS47562.1 putative peptidoglycan lipid II flippase [Jannaschia aquimarina]